MTGTNETNFPHNLPLIDRQVISLCMVFANDLSVIVKLSKAESSIIIQSGEFLVRLLGKSITSDLTFMRNVPCC